MSKLAKALTAAAGNAGGDNLYVEDVFSTYLYEGNGTGQTITNGIDLDGEGGLVWAKSRTNSRNNILSDTERGTGRVLFSNLTAAEDIDSTTITSYNSDGFSMGSSTLKMNTNGEDFASWTFRKAEKFFDVVTYTGTGVAGRTVAHNLGSIPACMIVKRTNAAQGWAVYHVGMDATNPENWMMRLNATNARFDLTPTRWNDTAPTSTEFTLSDNDEVNGSGDTYVAYLFASDAGGFGDDGSESIIKCGSYTGNDLVDGPEINLGWEPQWLLIKSSTGSFNWVVVDNMRGIPSGGITPYLIPNSSDGENTASGNLVDLTPTGFKLKSGNAQTNNPETYIYIAIRRPMKTPESGTEVFSPVARTGTGAEAQVDAGFAVDLSISSERGTVFVGDKLFFDKLRGANARLTSTATSAESSSASDMLTAFTNTGVTLGADANWYINKSGNPYINWYFKRATGFFDVVAYTGDGTGSRDIAHNLGVTPELVIFKSRSATADWKVTSSGTVTLLNSDSPFNVAALAGGYLTGQSATFIRTVPYSGSEAAVNTSAATYIAYLFATLAGVSKVSSYTGTAADLNVDCGFSAGARFILIKRTDSTGDWYVWDSARGIVAGNDPYLLLNSAAAEVTSTDYIDPLSSGFTVTSSAPAALNASGGTYIFLAIA
jgi:hypothetical protein